MSKRESLDNNISASLRLPCMAVDAGQRTNNMIILASLAVQQVK
jgi:hypothetical protein